MDRLASADQLLAAFAVQTPEERAKLQDVALSIVKDPGLRRVLGPGTDWWGAATIVLSDSFTITPQQMLDDLETLSGLRLLDDDRGADGAR